MTDKDFGAPRKSYMTNCHVEVRSDETADCLFKFFEDGSAIVKLDRYAIVPVEQWEALKATTASAVGTDERSEEVNQNYQVIP